MSLLGDIWWLLRTRRRIGFYTRSYLRKHWLTWTVPGLTFTGPAFIGRDVKFEAPRGGGRIVVGKYAWFMDHTRVRAHAGVLTVADKTVLGSRVTVNAWERIEIGRAVLIGDDVYICDFDHRTDLLDVPIKDQGLVTSPVVIGDDTWIGTKVTILRGSALEPGCVVAAGAVVRGRWPARSILGGVPARLLRSRDPEVTVVKPVEAEPVLRRLPRWNDREVTGQ